MKSERTQKRFAYALSLSLSAILLIGCAGIRVKVATDCSWAEPIEASDRTADWLNDLGFSEEKLTLLESQDWESWSPEIQQIVTDILSKDDWPEGFEDFMKDIGDHNELYYRWCNE